MPLDPQAKALLDAMAAMGMPPMHTMSVEQIRHWMVAGEATMGELDKGKQTLSEAAVALRDAFGNEAGERGISYEIYF
jgi:hypothetical protein